MSPYDNEQRVAVLADSQNLYHTAKNLYSANVDYNRLLSGAVKDRTLTRAIAYVIETETSEESQFFNALKKIGFERKMKDIQHFSDGTKKADWDVGICLDAVSLANKVDTIVLCTGDGDFSRLCDHLKHEGVKVEAMAFKESTSEELISAANKFVNLSNNKQQYLL